MARDRKRRRRWLSAVALLLLPALAAAQLPAPPDSLVAAGADSLSDSLSGPLAEAAIEPPPDFFDTGIDGTAAVLMTPIFPGWGQLYAATGWRAMVSFGAQWYFWSHMFSSNRQAVRYREHGQLYPSGSSARSQMDRVADEYYELVRDYAWWSAAALLLVALDAYVGAGLYGFDEEPIPVPNSFDEYFDRGVPEPPGSRDAQQLIVWQWGRKF